MKKTPDNASETVEDGIRDKEGRILKYVKDDAYVVATGNQGENFDLRRTGRKD